MEARGGEGGDTSHGGALLLSRRFACAMVAGGRSGAVPLDHGASHSGAPKRTISQAAPPERVRNGTLPLVSPALSAAYKNPQARGRMSHFPISFSPPSRALAKLS
uniref:Uncharacterized protein n=1 Tax=Oryza rufipogon TaxID=4529 RepID=A0A0E0MXB0_ORYRU